MTLKLGFGCMRLPLLDPKDDSKIDIEQFKKMVDTFLARGFTYFDTAYMYHGSKSELAVKEALVKRHPRNSFTVADKLPLYEVKQEGDAERIFNEQLGKVGVTYFDYYLLHNVNRNDVATIDKFNLFDFVIQKQKEGKIKHLGFSFHDMPELLDKILTAHPEVEFVQLQLNYADWDNPNVKAKENYDVVVKHGKKVIVMEPVKGGYLAKLSEPSAKLLKAYNPKASQASWAIRFAYSQPAVMMILSGMSDYAQLDDNTTFMKEVKPLNKEENKILKDVLALMLKETAIPCTACGYCMEQCPIKMPIPKIFAIYNTAKSPHSPGLWGQMQAYAKLCQEGSKPADCMKCGLCSSICPQHLEIPHLLEVVDKELNGE